MRVLLVEDDTSTAKSIEMMLRSDGYVVDVTDLGEDGLEIGKLYDYDIIILDLMLPDIDGYEVLRRLRASRVRTPILILSGLSELDHKVKGLGFGADDYLTKPFHKRELIARIRANTRRLSATDDKSLVVGDTVLDPSRYEIRIGTIVFTLPRKEFQLAQMLMERHGRVVTRETLLEQIWGIHWGDSKTLDQHIRRLRRRFEQIDDAPRITTVRGVGYRLEP